MRNQAREEFTATVKSIRLNQDQLETMSQKVSARIKQSKEYKRQKFQLRAKSVPYADQDSEAWSISGTVKNHDQGPLVPKSSTRYRRKSALIPLTPNKGLPMLVPADPAEIFYPYHATQTPKPALSRPLDMNFGNLAASAMQEMRRPPPQQPGTSQSMQKQQF